MRRRQLWTPALVAIGLLLGLGCETRTAPSGGEKITIFYSGNLWGELLECG